MTEMYMVYKMVSTGVFAFLVFLVDVATLQAGQSYTLLQEDAVIESNSFSRLYQKDCNRTWHLYTTEGLWAVVFEKFALEPSKDCQHDSLTITEVREKSVENVVYCGDHVPRTYISHGPDVTITFVSDDMWELDGFTLRVIHAPENESMQKKLSEESPIHQGLHLHGEEPKHKDKEPSTLFLVLVIAVSSGAIFFAGLLIYFLLGMSRRRQRNAQTGVVAFVKDRSNAIRLVGKTKGRQWQFQNFNKNENFVMVSMENGRRYSKDKRAASEDTYPKNIASDLPGASNVHTNVYVRDSQMKV